MSVWTPNMHLSIEGDQVQIPHSNASLLPVEVLQRSRSPEASSFSESCLALLGKLLLDNSQQRGKVFLETEEAVTQHSRVNTKRCLQKWINFFLEEP